MSGIPYELIREVQMSTRAAANLSDYDPSDTTLPELPSLSSEIAASDSSAHLRCENCTGRLLRGSASIICLYCGRRPIYDVLPEPISYTSSVGYKWLLRALRLDGSEMVDPRNKSEQDQDQASTKALIPLSDFVDFKILWPAETGKQETSISDNLPKQSGSFSLTEVDPVKFLLKLTRDVTFDPSFKQPIKHEKIDAADKNSETPDQQNLFQNVQSSEPDHQNLLQNGRSVEPIVNSSQRETSDDFSEWEADFQFAGSQNQESGHKSAEHLDLSADSGINFQVSISTNYSVDSEVDLAAQIDSVFGPGKDIENGKLKENSAAYPVFDLWNNLSSVNSHSVDGFDAAGSTKDGDEDVLTFETSRDLSTSVNLLQDFQLQPNYADMSLYNTTNEEQTTMNLDSFEEWNDFTGFSSVQDALQASANKISTFDKNTPGIDLFNFNNKFEEGDFGSFSQPGLFFSASKSNSTSLLEVDAVMSENPASIRSNDTTISHFSTAGQPANNTDGVVKRTKDDDIKTLISQMHDLSFMLEADLCVPASSDTHNKD